MMVTTTTITNHVAAALRIAIRRLLDTLKPFQAFGSRLEWCIFEQTIHTVASRRYAQHSKDDDCPDRKCDPDRGNADTGALEGHPGPAPGPSGGEPRRPRKRTRGTLDRPRSTARTVTASEAATRTAPAETPASVPVVQAEMQWQQAVLDQLEQTGPTEELVSRLRS